MALREQHPELLVDDTTGTMGYKNPVTGKDVVVPDPAIVSITPNNIVLDNASVGATTGWLQTAAGMERYGFNLLSGASAGITIDGSNDGVTSAGQVATVNLDTTGSTFISGPIKPLYPFIRFTVSSGAGVAQIARGM